MSEEYVGIQEMTILVIYGLSPLAFLQTKQLISLVFLFCKIREEAIASSCLLLATPMLLAFSLFHVIHVQCFCLFIL